MGGPAGIRSSFSRHAIIVIVGMQIQMQALMLHLLAPQGGQNVQPDFSAFRNILLDFRVIGCLVSWVPVRMISSLQHNCEGKRKR
mmetsp:Transcript_32122/g.63296  ORF Transcript_32122/g.63296 Transcript_32122/m.63296 type:complete len:85 (-) Transcript_32122:21-275(-)